jgi:hypothetical protein
MADSLGGSLVHPHCHEPVLFRDTAYVQAQGLDRTLLWYTLMAQLGTSLKNDAATLQRGRSGGWAPSSPPHLRDQNKHETPRANPLSTQFQDKSWTL